MTQKELDELSIKTLRMLSIDMIDNAGSGHPGLPLGAAKLTYLLWKNFLRHNPKDPNWINRDRFILSPGHGSALLYSLLYLSGYDISLEDLKQFRQLSSKCPGHPEYGKTPGVETTTGPLGQGFATGVGMAIGEKILKEKNKAINYTIYGLCSDGDMMEGVTHEAASLAGHLKLDNLIYVYLDNHITIEGNTNLSFSEHISTRFLSYGWKVFRIEAYDEEQFTDSLQKALTQNEDPVLIIARTHIGLDVPTKQDTSAVHGKPLTKQERIELREELNWPNEDWVIPNLVLNNFREAIKKGHILQLEWESNHATNEFIEDMPIFEELEKVAPKFSEKAISTRDASGKILNFLSSTIQGLIGGAADLSPSCKTHIEGELDFEANKYSGKNLHFGIREHAMGAILNGMALTHGIIPYGATFLVFSDYMKPSIRLAAMMKLKVIYIFTHDSIFVGQDGATHQPIEQLAGLRAIPNLLVIRPADANETRIALLFAVSQLNKGPVALILTRQKIPMVTIKTKNLGANLINGGYIIDACKKETDITIIATGSEVSLAIEVKNELTGSLSHYNISVVSMPCQKLFFKQPREYRNSVIPETSKIVIIEAGSRLGWDRFGGKKGLYITLDEFGDSAPEKDMREKYGFTVNTIKTKILNWLGK